MTDKIWGDIIIFALLTFGTVVLWWLGSILYAYSPSPRTPWKVFMETCDAHVRWLTRTRPNPRPYIRWPGGSAGYQPEGHGLSSSPPPNAQSGVMSPAGRGDRPDTLRPVRFEFPARAAHVPAPEDLQSGESRHFHSPSDVNVTDAEGGLHRVPRTFRHSMTVESETVPYEREPEPDPVGPVRHFGEIHDVSVVHRPIDPSARIVNHCCSRCGHVEHKEE